MIKVLLNPFAIRKSTVSRAQIEGAFAAVGASVELVETMDAAHMRAQARSAARDGVELLVAAGGDGTVSSVINGLVEADPAVRPAVRIGVLPLGGGNDFAYVLGFPRDLVQAARFLVRGRTRAVDVGRITLHEGDETRVAYFNNSMGLGLEGAVVLESERLRNLPGSLRYVVATLRALPACSSPIMRIEQNVEGTTVLLHDGPALMVSVGNTRRSGGGLYLTPEALPDDGEVDVGVLRRIPKWRVLGLLPLAKFGQHVHDPALNITRTASFTVDCAEGTPVHADGETIAHAAQRVEVTVLRQWLNVIDCR